MNKITIETVKEVIQGSRNFFRNLKKEKSVGKGVSYFVVLSFLAIGISLFAYTERLNDNIARLYSLTGLNLLDFGLDVTWDTYVLLLVSFVLLATLFTFVRYYIVHFFVSYFVASKYKDTYNSLSFSVTPGYIGLVLFGIAFLLWPIEIFIVQVLAWLFFISSIFFEGYSFYIRSKGLAVTHGISVFSAFLCIYVFTGLVLLLIGGIMLGAVLLIA